jgi:PKD repeat protein
MNRLRTVLAGAALSVLSCGALHAADLSDSGAARVEVGEPVTPISIDVDLRTLPVVPAWRPGMAVKEAHKRQFFPPDRPDPAAPDWMQASPDRLPELQKLWDENAPSSARRRGEQGRVSINNGSTGVSPGDPVVDVSANYIVYGVNGSSGTNFTVYNKSGTKLAGPTTFSSLAPSGDGCRTSVSDPIVLFDRLANRWFLLEMGGTSSAPKMCIYVSKTENPVSGGWWFYGFPTPTQNDYPHCGVWPNAYVCTDNEGQSNVTAYAYDRANMLNGATARPQQRFVSVPKLAGYGFQALTPATFMGDGAHAPPAGTAQILARHNDDEAHAGTSADTTRDFIDLYAINVDWNTPSNSAITTLPRIAITEFNSWFRDYSTFATVPQPGSTSRLDPIREVILNSLVYRNLGSYESLVGQFATNINPARSGTTVNAGIRWFELRRTGGGSWTLQQEGTFGPGDTSTNHLVGSIATDNKGNIGLGYNVTKTSSPTIYASLGYTGRKASDPAGVMTLGENTVAAGSAVETSGRWGDYYQMAVDPTDDCTFWMVGMYRPSGSWNTRIQDFKFDDCGAGPSTWSVSGTVTTGTGVGISGVTVSAGTASTTTNSSGAYTLGGLANGTYTLTPSLAGYTFSPASSSVTISGANVTGRNFTGTPTATNSPPTANFGVVTNGLTANFTDSSTDADGTIVARAWTFGDGATSTATNPSHTYAAAGTYSVSLTVTDDGSLTGTKTQSVTVSTSGNVLQNGVTVTGLAATTGNFLVYTLNVPAGATNLKFVTSGGSGDGDLYVRFGAAPTTSTYDCRSWNSGNSETCNIATAQAGTYYVMVYAYSSFSGLGLTGSYSTGGGTTLSNGVAVTGLAATSGNWTPTYTLVVPSGATNLSFAISGGTGDADLYVRLGSAPTTGSYTCRPYLSGNNETCSWTAPTPGTYYVAVRAYSTFSGVTLLPKYTP